MCSLGLGDSVICITAQMREEKRMRSRERFLLAVACRPEFGKPPVSECVSQYRPSPSLFSRLRFANQG
jgi:hypothetical protein